MFRTASDSSIDLGKYKVKSKCFVLVLLMLFALLQLTMASMTGLQKSVTILSAGTVLPQEQPIEVGLRTDCFWDQYIKNPGEFLALAKGRVSMIYVDLPWVKELFINFDPNNLDKRFGEYPYTFGDYISFFRALHQEGYKIVFGPWGQGYCSTDYLNFFVDYPASNIGDGRWVNPGYVDPSWNGKNFIQMYAEKIDAFTNFVGIPAIVSWEDYRYPGYLMQYPQLIQFRNSLKALNQSNEVWMPPASFCSARVADYNDFKEDNPWTWEFSSEDTMVGGSDIILQNVWDYAGVYHSAMNVVGWLGAQMSGMPYNSGIIVKLYWGGSDLNTNSPNYSLPQMKKKLEDIITACYLTRILASNGEYCPVRVFVLTYKPPPTATLTDMLEILEYAKDMSYLRTAKVLGPILKIPRNLGYTTYPDNLSPMGGYMIGKGLIPFRFVYEDYSGNVDPTEKIVTQSAKDYSAEFAVNFSTSSQCTWLGMFDLNGHNYYAVFHDGGYEGGVYNADGTYQPPDKTSYIQNTTISVGTLTVNIPADSLTVFDAQGNGL